MPSLRLLSTAALLPIYTAISISISLPPSNHHQAQTLRISRENEHQLLLNQGQHQLNNPSAAAFECDLPPVQVPSSEDGLPDSKDIFFTDAALKKQVERHGAIVKVPSICYDDLGGFEEDERWAAFYDLHEALRETFPLV